MSNNLPKSLFFGWRYIMIAILFSLFLCSCEKEKIVVQGGSLRYADASYSIKKVKVEHVGYEGEDYVLRLLAYPSTYTVSETTTSGYGCVIDARFVSATKDFEVGAIYELYSDSSFLTFYPEIPKGDTLKHDTIAYCIASGELRVDTADGYRTFQFGFLTTDGDSIVGSYLGDYSYNYIVDQKAYGELQFDTISCQLAMPMLLEWKHLFSESNNYYEFVFYSIDSRFTDAGKIKSGVQFVVGVHDVEEERPIAGEYMVSSNPDEAMSVYYGHKLNNTSWGTYWHVLYNNSTMGKANIVEGLATFVSIEDTSLNMTFTFTDQLGHEVVGSYSGPYLVTSY